LGYLLAGVLLGLLFNPEDGISMLIQNVGGLLEEYIIIFLFIHGPEVERSPLILWPFIGLLYEL
jgi:hypothetical protein